MTLDNKLSYRDALDKVKILTTEIEQMDGDIDSLIGKVKEVKSLIHHCEQKVWAAEMEIRDIFNEEE